MLGTVQVVAITAHALLQPAAVVAARRPGVVIDIGRIRALSDIRDAGGHFAIGAITTHQEIAGSTLLKDKCPLLPETASRIGDVQVRNKGTIGGSLSHADPAADYPASILALDATIVALGPKGERQIPASKFFVDMLTTALEPNEIVREIQIPLRSGRTGSAYLKMAQKASGFAICGAAAVVELDGSGRLSNVGIGITGVGNHAFRATDTEKALNGQKPAPDLLKKACESAGKGIIALDDIHASANYRLDLARVFSRRALEAAIERAG